MKIKTLTAIQSKEEAREIAIKWQRWQSKKSMFYSEISEWHKYFELLAKKFGLKKEFRENAII